MSDEEPLTRKHITVFMLRWVEELIRLSELSCVLRRSIEYNHMNGNEANKGDDQLIRHIRDGIDNLFAEIEDAIEQLEK